MKRSRSFYLLLLSLMCYNCSNDIKIDLPVYQPKLAVDGFIELNGYPVVVLTHSNDYFADIDSSNVRQLVETKAKVTVSDGENVEILTLKKNSKYFPSYIYQGNEIKGVSGKTYTLKIELTGKTYTASTSIPQASEIDSLWFEQKPESDSLGYLYGSFKDDGTAKNFYRLFTKRKSKDSDYIPIYLSAIGDEFFNGKSFTFSLLRGSESLSNVGDDIYFQKGDTISVKFCTIDQDSFDFWRTLEHELYVIGNPFASAGNQIFSNIKGEGVLGVWTGYGSEYYTIIAE